MINGIFVLVMAFVIVGGFTLIPRAIQHDRLLEEPEEVDHEALVDFDDQRYTDDADAWRKGES